MKPHRLVGLALLVATGCDSEIDTRIGAALRGTAERVIITETYVEAVCVGGQVVKVPVAELGLDLLGMADIEKQTAVAKQLAQQCEGFVREKAEAERTESTFAAVAKELDLTLGDEPLEEQRAAVCKALHARLPVRGPARAEAIASHTSEYGCEDPGEPELGPERYWQVETKGKGKQTAVYLRLAADPLTEEREQLTIRCRRKKAELYLETQQTVGKGPLVVALDGKKRRWLTRSSKSGSAVFLKDGKKGVRDLLGKKRLEVTYPGKGTEARTFDVEGIEAALKPYRRRCRL